MQETTPQAEQNEDFIHHAGDKGFKFVMKDKDSALELVEKFVPNVYEHIDTATFDLDNTNYVNKDFQEYYSDVVYRTYLKKTSNAKSAKKKEKPVAIALLFEHKKKIDSYFLLLLQLLEYIIFIWREDLSNKRDPSVVIPIVVFQGKHGLRVKELHDCFKGIPKELLQYIPNLKCHFTQVHSLSNATLLGLNEKNFLRSLFLGYTFTDKEKDIKDMFLEVFKFFKHRPDSMAFFQLMFQFLSQETVLNSEQTKELFDHYYLSPQQTEGVMNTYQVLRQEGRQEGRQENARLTVLRGKSNKIPTETLAYLSDLPIQEVNNLLKGYDKAYKFWLKNKGKAPVQWPPIEYLSEQEVAYLMNFFSQKLPLATEN